MFVDIRVGEVSHRLRWIPPGSFWMGSPEGEDGRFESEGPRHQVTITRGFWLGETPVTQDLWEIATGENPSRFQSARRPVEQVSWDDCRGFIEQLNDRVSGLEARLPTEAEWEYACRADTKASTYAGELEIEGVKNEPVLDEIAWYGGNSGVGFDLDEGHDSSGRNEKQFRHVTAGTRIVGLKRPNPWGLHDMLGNVWEWCEDAWDFETGFPEDESRVDPVISGGAARVIRGGSWDSLARNVRAAFRFGLPPGSRFDNVGFRLARGQGAEPEQDGEAGRAAGRRRGERGEGRARDRASVATSARPVVERSSSGRAID